MIAGTILPASFSKEENMNSLKRIAIATNYGNKPMGALDLLPFPINNAGKIVAIETDKDNLIKDLKRRVELLEGIVSRLNNENIRRTLKKENKHSDKWNDD
jgi:hypothetical protein